MKLYPFLILLLNVQLVVGQKISNVNFNTIKSLVEDKKSTFYYPNLLERMRNLDTSITTEEFSYLYYGNVYFEKYSPYSTGKNQEEFFKFYNKKEYEKAIPLGLKELEENPINLTMLFKMLVCYHVSGDKSTARKYAKLYYGLLGSIYDSGDGKGIETAFVVIKVADEYQILADLELESTSQSLQGDTDVLVLDKKSQEKIEKLYFNVRKPLESLRNQFRSKKKD
ncbi:MAG: hypothetical protein RL264_2879 [Bacteroidota bacterium]